MPPVPAGIRSTRRFTNYEPRRAGLFFWRMHGKAMSSASETVTVIIDHRLGKDEAVRRIKEGLARTSGHFGSMIAVEQPTWVEDTLRFRLRALGQTAAARIEVLEDALRIEVSLPWLLAKAAGRLLPVLRKETARLLEK